MDYKINRKFKSRQEKVGQYNEGNDEANIPEILSSYTHAGGKPQIP